MSTTEFTKCITYLGICYNFSFDETRVKVWYSFFKDIDYVVMKVAIKQNVPLVKRTPNIAELMEWVYPVDQTLKESTIYIDGNERCLNSDTANMLIDECIKEGRDIRQLQYKGVALIG